MSEKKTRWHKELCYHFESWAFLFSSLWWHVTWWAYKHWWNTKWRKPQRQKTPESNKQEIKCELEQTSTESVEEAVKMQLMEKWRKKRGRECWSVHLWPSFFDLSSLLSATLSADRIQTTWLQLTEARPDINTMTGWFLSECVCLRGRVCFVLVGVYADI